MNVNITNLNNGWSTIEGPNVFSIVMTMVARPGKARALPPPAEHQEWICDRNAILVTSEDVDAIVNRLSVQPVSEIPEEPCRHCGKPTAGRDGEAPISRPDCGCRD